MQDTSERDRLNGLPPKSPPESGQRHHRRYRITEGAEEIQMRKATIAYTRLTAGCADNPLVSHHAIIT
jgi:hypothetical protein